MSVGDLKSSFRELVREETRKNPDRFYYPPQDRSIHLIPGNPSSLQAKVQFVERKEQ